MIECIITLVQGVFFSTGVSACVLLLNKKKEESHKNKICMIDASNIYTAMRAQNIMTTKDINEGYSLYKEYKNVNEKCQIVDIKDINNILSPKIYIKNNDIVKINPNVIKEKYLLSIAKVKTSEAVMKKLFLEGGYIDEF